MRVDKLTAGKIFDPTERLDAPLFQRPYVWEEDANWTPLWESIQLLADKRFAGGTVRPHFLGAIVLDQMETPTGRLPLRQIIDGQQRLTTLQLLLAAARDLSTTHKVPKYAQAFQKLTENDFPLSEGPDERFKVWPTNADREQFRAVMTAGDTQKVLSFSENSRDDKRIAGAYLYFANALSEWLEQDTSSVAHRIDALYGALRDDVLLVVIDLEVQDDAQEIFETLNALGTPLFTADLVKNHLFRLAQRGGEDVNKLYERYWLQFDNEQGYWRAEVRQGRLKRPRIDLFLHNYLTLQTAQEINVNQLFSAYRDFVGKGNGQTAGKQLALFRSYADIYKSFEALPEYSREALFFYRLQQLDTTTVYPLLLEVFKRFGTPEGCETREQIIGDLESYFVRRAVCELTTKNYNRFFVDLIRRLQEKDDFTGGAVRAALLEGAAETTLWPSDVEFTKAWLNGKMYKRLKRSKTRMILEALEGELHTNKTERISLPTDLTVEHLMPREWERHWPLSVDHQDSVSVERATNEREELMNTVGNLTLLTKALNPSVSNGPWAKKRPEILKHSALNLNRSLPDLWNESAIRARADELFRIALAIWPRPS